MGNWTKNIMIDHLNNRKHTFNWLKSISNKILLWSLAYSTHSLTILGFVYSEMPNAVRGEPWLSNVQFRPYSLLDKCVFGNKMQLIVMLSKVSYHYPCICLIYMYQIFYSPTSATFDYGSWNLLIASLHSQRSLIECRRQSVHHYFTLNFYSPYPPPSGIRIY
jgi:hypothetical protein